jgi:hypothetical protein
MLAPMFEVLCQPVLIYLEQAHNYRRLAHTIESDRVWRIYALVRSNSRLSSLDYLLAPLMVAALACMRQEAV